mgnify:FL=1
MSFKHENWSSKSVFLLAAIGAAVGLGNIWRFPYMAGTNGGGAFVIIYLAAVVLIAIPVLIAETMIGKNGQMSPPVSMAKAAESSNASGKWSIVGWLGVASAFLILSFYSVIGGWVFSYIPAALMGLFENLNSTRSTDLFNNLTSNPIRVISWHTFFMFISTLIVMRGIKGGLELAVKFMMPSLFVILICLCLFSLAQGDSLEGIRFLFMPDFSKITPEVILAAIGQAFFSIGVGIGIMFTYGAYLPKNISLPNTCITIAFADTLVAIIAGLVIFPIVFTSGLDPSAGPSLVFITLPIAFGQMSGGELIGIAFYLLLSFAALTSAISLLEVPVSWLEEKPRWTRKSASLLVSFLVWLTGISSALSTNILSDVYLLSFITKFQTYSILDLTDYLTGQLLLPLGGMFIAIFTGWYARDEILKTELNKNSIFFTCWKFSIRYICPIAIFFILASAWV